MNRYYRPDLITFFAFFVISCSTVPKPPEPVTQPDIPVKQYPVSGWQYHDLALKLLRTNGRTLLDAKPADGEKWCKSFAAVDKAEFYAHLFAALAKFESGWRDAETYTEDFNDAKGKPVVSRGQLQISQESANSYGCNITDPKQLYDAETNIGCGIKIAARWVNKDGVIQGGVPGAWLGYSRYWSPFRKADRIAAIKDKLSVVCK